MSTKPIIIHHLVKSSDLNHHETLYAGRGAEWLVEAGFIAAASLTNPENTVCLNIHGMIFTKPVAKGSLLKYESRIVYAGRTSLVAYVRVNLSQTSEFIVEGFLTFIHVVKGKAVPHSIVIHPETPEEIALYEQGKALKTGGHQNSGPNK